MKFVDFDERELTTREMLTTAFQGLSAVTGITAFPMLPSALPSAGRFDMEFVVLSSDRPEEMLPHARSADGNGPGKRVYSFLWTPICVSTCRKAVF